MPLIREINGEQSDIQTTFRLYKNIKQNYLILNIFITKKTKNKHVKYLLENIEWQISIEFFENELMKFNKKIR